jgi:hypothetical protein
MREEADLRARPLNDQDRQLSGVRRGERQPHDASGSRLARSEFAESYPDSHSGPHAQGDSPREVMLSFGAAADGRTGPFSVDAGPGRSLRTPVTG